MLWILVFCGGWCLVVRQEMTQQSIGRDAIPMVASLRQQDGLCQLLGHRCAWRRRLAISVKRALMQGLPLERALQQLQTAVVDALAAAHKRQLIFSCLSVRLAMLALLICGIRLVVFSLGGGQDVYLDQLLCLLGTTYLGGIIYVFVRQIPRSWLFQTGGQQEDYLASLFRPGDRESVRLALAAERRQYYQFLENKRLERCQSALCVVEVIGFGGTGMLMLAMPLLNLLPG